MNSYVKPTFGGYKYDNAVVQIDINDYFRCKNDSELKELTNKYNRNMENLPKIAK